MKKLLFFVSLYVIHFSVTSCVDPNTVAIANGTTNSGISGPRILEKVTENSQDWEYYNSASGVVSSYWEKTWENGAVTETHQYTITYSGEKVTKFKMVSSQPNNSTTLASEIIPAYDSSGKIVSYDTKGYLNTINNSDAIGTISYDSSEKLIKVSEKFGPVPAASTSIDYNGRTTVNLTYNGENVSKIVQLDEIIDTSTTPATVDQSTTSIYEFSQFDSMHSPYSPYSKNLRVCMGVLAKPLFDRMSPNNPIKTKITLPTLLNPLEGTKVYQYDTQSYLSNDYLQKFTYKAI